MNIIEEFLKEINSLQEYKRLYESQKIDKSNMSYLLFELMTYKYNNTPYEQRLDEFKKTTCRDCKSRDYCTKQLPECILKPVVSENGWIPAKIGCSDFEWS